jgi:hypothetical protein
MFVLLADIYQRESGTTRSGTIFQDPLQQQNGKQICLVVAHSQVFCWWRI